MDESRVVIRPFYTETDEPFIYSSWRNSAYYLGVPRGTVDAKDFFKKQTGIIRKILPYANVKIACLEHDPMLIIGFSVSTGTHLNWVYVKVEYRNCGVGKMLVPGCIETVTDQLTKIGSSIVEKKSLKTRGDFDGQA